NSLTMTAMRRPWTPSRMRRTRVVLPAPRKPVTMVHGTLAVLAEWVVCICRSNLPHRGGGTRKSGAAPGVARLVLRRRAAAVQGRRRHLRTEGQGRHAGDDALAEGQRPLLPGDDTVVGS